MTSLPCPTAPLAILQADGAYKITSEERVSQYMLNGDESEPNLLPQGFPEILPLPPIFPFKNCHNEQNLQSLSLNTSPPSPQITSSSGESTFPFY